jgi:hypothetical protein
MKVVHRKSHKWVHTHIASTAWISQQQQESLCMNLFSISTSCGQRQRRPMSRFNFIFLFLLLWCSSHVFVDTYKWWCHRDIVVLLFSINYYTTPPLFYHMHVHSIQFSTWNMPCEEVNKNHCHKIQIPSLFITFLVGDIILVHILYFLLYIFYDNLYSLIKEIVVSFYLDIFKLLLNIIVEKSIKLHTHL